MTGSPTLVRLRHLSDRPGAAASASVTFGVAFVLCRLAVAAHGNITQFIVVGTVHTSPTQLPKGIAFHPGNGYDGQFYYRMALDPLNFARTAFGIRFDSLSRLERIGYPALAWLLAGGQHHLVPVTLVITNVVALGALGYGAALLARDSGRHAMWGVVIAGFWGYLWTLGRDLTEVTAAAFLLLGLHAYRRDRWVLAGFLFLGAALSKETAAFVVGIIAVTRVVGWLARRDRRPPSRHDLAWALPLLGFAAWEAAIFATLGTIPLLSSGKQNIVLPFVGMVAGLSDHLPGLPSVPSSLWLGELLIMVLLAVGAGMSSRSTSAPLYERVAWAAVLLVAVCAAPGIWRGNVGFRSLDDTYLFSWILLLGSRRRLGAVGVISGIAWLVVAVELVIFV